MNPLDPLGELRRRALVVATGRYRHDELPDLDSPAQDAEYARRILGNPAIGDFHPFKILLNNDVRTLTNEIYDFFAAADKDEFLFAYFSCHGRRDPDGRLYLTTIDTEPDRLPPTAIAADDIRNWMDNCPAQVVVMVLDCCHAGAFAGDPRQRSKRDRIVLLATGANELAHEGRSGQARAMPSAFAGAFFDGLETGLADRNFDGVITVREAFDYAAAKLIRSQTPQTPQMRANVARDIVLCTTPPNPGRLSRDLESLVRNGLPTARLLAVEQLAQWMESPERAQARTAESTLIDLSSDDDERVAAAADRVLNHRLATRTPIAAGAPPVAPKPDQFWYTTAVFYEVRVRTFHDSNGDGIGDLQGLIGKLDYLQWLGVDCLLLAPIYDSPLHDDGYDISDFGRVHPDLGTTDDLVELVERAHAQGIKVVLDVVLNHTSDAHEWFEKSRTDPDGPYGDFYVWQDDDERYADARTLGEESARDRWTFDRQRKQFYWHRFADHEPDLNFDNRAVQDAIVEALCAWLDLGIDGFRLLTAPYLFERDGTPSEGLDETHEYLAAVRQQIDKKYEGRVLIAWCDGWPSDAAEYFGTTRSECHVVLYSSLMPRVFLSMRQENHAALSTVLAQSRGIPEHCQWGIFLRNGDEMTLDLVTDDERAYLLREYAPLKRMRNARGIRRRLAPLHNGKTDQLSLCIALLLSLPGAPILYYGDEIGMGENLSLSGTAAIRTPMQWSSDRASGFSDAEYEQLAAPVVLDSVYGYQSVNVEAQLRRPTSLLQTVKRLIEIRRHSPALTTGAFQQLKSENPAIWCYVRSTEVEEIVCVVNFSGYPQATELDLVQFAGKQPVEVTGGARFPEVASDGRYQVTLSGNGFYWLRMANRQSHEPEKPAAD